MKKLGITQCLNHMGGLELDQNFSKSHKYHASTKIKLSKPKESNSHHHNSHKIPYAKRKKLKWEPKKPLPSPLGALLYQRFLKKEKKPKKND